MKSIPPVIIHRIMLGVLLFMPAIIFFMPISTMDQYGSICLIKAVTGHECPGCGMSHAIYNVLHLNFTDAFSYNKLVIVIFPLLSYIWLKKIISEFRKSFPGMQA